MLILEEVTAKLPLLEVVVGKITPKVIFNRHYTIHIGELENSNLARSIYTDGSRSITGAGVSTFSDDLDLCTNVPIEIHANVFQTKIIAIILDANAVLAEFRTNLLQFTATVELLC